MSTGLGVGPYGLQAYGQAADEPTSLAPAKIGSARKIDFKTRRYVVASDGGFEAMDETAQRVAMITAFALRDEPPFITPQDEARIEQKVRAAFADAGMTDVRDPDIDLESVDISHDTNGNSFRGVRYKNLRTGTYQYVSPR